MMNIKAYITFVSLLFATSCFATSPTAVADVWLVGEWVGESNTLRFGADGAMEQYEDDTLYRLHYQFDGELLCTIVRDGRIEYLDYFFVLVDANDPAAIGVIHYEYVYNVATDEIWDPELMSFDDEASRRHFARYRAEFERSGEAIDRWFDRYTRAR